MNQEGVNPALSKPTALARSRSRYKGSRPKSAPVLHSSGRKPDGKILGQELGFPQTAVETPNVHTPIVNAASGLSTSRSAVVQQLIPTREVQRAWAEDRDRAIATPRESSALGRDCSAAIPSEARHNTDASDKSSSQHHHTPPNLGHRDGRSHQSTSSKTQQRAEHQLTTAGGLQDPRESSRFATPKARKRPPGVGAQGIEGATPVKPAFDVPVSAVNAGERRVAVEHHNMVISVPITPSTTSVDLVREASQQLGMLLDPQVILVLESFRQLGLQRPLRKYENIRSVLNSWDFDAQNALILTSTTNFGKKDDLDIQSMHGRHTKDVSATMYHSQRPRHWDKQTLTLRPDGQLLVMKKGGSANVCHLSDFDIYVPTKSQLSKSIRPPKKLCFAIKSQQKSSMFLSTDNFVHFLCTKDKDLAKSWYAAIQSWRSWYLITVMGQGQSQSLIEAQVLNKQQSSLARATSNAKLLEADQSSEKPSQVCSRGCLSDTSPLAPAKRPSTDHSSRSQEVHGINIQRKPFSSTGLLGRTYTQRKKAQEQQSENILNQEGRVIHVPLRQSGTIRLPGVGITAPLIDLTPHYQEPPQHRKGKGVTPEIMPAGGLVEVATTLDVAIPIPPLVSWQRNEAHTQSFRNQNRQRPPFISDATMENLTSNHGATTKGLICTNTPSQGDLGHGRGVQTGDWDSKSPLIDINEGSRYAPGSLLASVEKYNGENRKPAIERERRKEVRVTVGET